MPLNRDFVEMLSALCDGHVEFLVVGAHAMAAHGYPRATGDLDIWVNPTAENARRAWRALAAFGAPLDALTEQDLVSPEVVFQIGVVPARIDVITQIDGVDFAAAWKQKSSARVGGIEIPVLSREHLLQNKRATGRPKDLADVAWLESETTG